MQLLCSSVSRHFLWSCFNQLWWKGSEIPLLWPWGHYHHSRECSQWPGQTASGCLSCWSLPLSWKLQTSVCCGLDQHQHSFTKACGVAHASLCPVREWRRHQEAQLFLGFRSVIYYLQWVWLHQGRRLPRQLQAWECLWNTVGGSLLLRMHPWGDWYYKAEEPILHFQSLSKGSWPRRAQDGRVCVFILSSNMSSGLSVVMWKCYQSVFCIIDNTFRPLWSSTQRKALGW